MDQIPERPKLTIAPKHLLILFIPVLVVSVSEALLAAFADTRVDLGEMAMIEDPTLVELKGRYRFLSVYFFYAATALMIIGVFAADLITRHSVKSLVRIGIGFVGLVLFSFLFSMLEPEWMGSFEAYELLGAELFEKGLGTGDMPLCTSGGCDGKGAFHAMRLLMNSTNIMSALAVPALVLGMIVALSRDGDIDLKSKAGILNEGRLLRDAQKAVRRYLYLSGVLLSAGMMLGLAWMKWPAELLADGSLSSGYSDLVDSVSLYRGVSYTILILSFYMPVSLIQMIRIDRFQDAASHKNMADIAEQLKGVEIERVGSLDAFKAILSILSPIIAGAIGSFVDFDVLG